MQVAGYESRVAMPMSNLNHGFEIVSFTLDAVTYAGCNRVRVGEHQRLKLSRRDLSAYIPGQIILLINQQADGLPKADCQAIVSNAFMQAA